MKWEYKVITLAFFDLKDVTGTLNAEGAQGWELAALCMNATWGQYRDKTDHLAIMKRPISN